MKTTATHKHSSRSREKLRELTDFQFVSVVTSWRHFCNGGTITAAGYSHDMIENFFNGEYDKKSMDRLARQFLSDFKKTDSGLVINPYESLNPEWQEDWEFLNAYLNKTAFDVTFREGGKKKGKLHTIECFQYSGTYRPMEEYVLSRYSLIPGEWVVRISEKECHER